MPIWPVNGRILMAQVISISEAKNQLSEFVSRAASSKEVFLIERRGRPLAALVSSEDLKLLEKIKEGGPEAGLFGIVGSWSEFDEELSRHVDQAIADRSQDKIRPVVLE